MSCSHDSQYLSALLDGELSAERAAEVATWLDECTSCREWVEEMTSLSLSLNLPVESDPGFLVRVREAREQATIALGRWRRLAIGLVPVTLGVLFAAGLMIRGSLGLNGTGAYAALERFELGDEVSLESPDGLAAEDSVLRIAVEPFDLGLEPPVRPQSLSEQEESVR